MFSLPSPQKINKRIQSRNIGVIDLASEKYFDKKFAVSVRDMNLRVKPTEMPKYSPEGFDMNCETLCRRGEIMILLSEKPKNGFYLVHSVNTFALPISLFLQVLQEMKIYRKFRFLSAQNCRLWAKTAPLTAFCCRLEVTTAR